MGGEKVAKQAGGFLQQKRFAERIFMDRESRLMLYLRYREIHDASIPYLESDFLGSKKAKAILSAFKEYGENDLSSSTLKSMLSEELKPKSVRIISREYREMPKSLPAKECDTILQKMERMIKDKRFESRISKIINSGKREDEDLTSMAEIAEFSLADDKILDFSKKKLVRNLIKGHLEHDLIPSSFSCINNTLQENAYAVGQIVMVVAAPSAGKSIFMITEGCNILKRGLKVLSIYLGDLNEYDVLCRWTSCLTQTELIKVAVNPMKYRTIARGYFKNHRALCYPSYELNALDLYHLCKRVKQKFNFDAVIIDYDSNIRPTIESMYQEGGATYALLDKIAKGLKCLVLVGSQSKNPYWQHEIIPIEAAAESSRKQHTVDVMIGLGRNQDAVKIGTVNLAKIRRGESGIKFRVEFSMKKSTINEISSEEYERIYTEAVGDSSNKEREKRKRRYDKDDEGSTNKEEARGRRERRKVRFASGR